MKNVIVIPSFHRGTSLDEMLSSIKKIITTYNLPIEIIGEDLEVVDISRNDAFDGNQEVYNYSLILQTLLKKKEIEKVLFLDFFFPGLDLYRYSMEITGTYPKLGSFLLGGTFLEGDLYKWKWLSASENVWFELYNTVFVPSQYLYEAVPSQYRDKVIIKPWGLDHSLEIIDKISKYKVDKDEYDVIFPHRLDEDKGIDDFFALVEALPEVNFYVTSYALPKNNVYYNRLTTYSNVIFLIGENDKQHLESLKKSKIVLSCAKQETHGYSVIKGVLTGAIPLVPQREVYPEYYSNIFIYSNIDDAVKKIKDMLNNESCYKKELSAIQTTLRQFSFKNLLFEFFEL